MTTKALVLATLAFALACVVACPRRPSSAAVDPAKLLHDALSARPELAYPRCNEILRNPRCAYSMPESERTELMVKSCRLTLDGEDSVSGRSAWVLRIEAKDDSGHNPRPWKQLWIDKRSHVPLLAREWSCRDRMQRQFAVKSAPTHVDYEYVWSSRPPPTPIEMLGDGVVEPRCLPEGCELVAAFDMQSPRTVRLLYSDGLQAISVYQRFPANPGRENTLVDSIRKRHQGAVAFSKQSGREIAVVADLPVKELRRIADSVR